MPFDPSASVIPTDPAPREADDPEIRAIGAMVSNSAALHSAMVMEKYSRPMTGPEGTKYTPSVDELMSDLKSRIGKAQGGDLADAEAMLMGQAHALQAIFSRLATKAQHATHLPTQQAYLTLALKAQSQCRTTIEALVEIKYPRQPTFVRAQNMAVNQQINNGVAARAREIENQQSKLSEGSDELLPHTRASAVTSGIDPQMEAVGAINGAENR